MKYLLLLSLGLGNALAGQITVPNSSFEDSAPGYGNPTGWTLFASTTSPTFSSNAQVVANNGSVYPTVSGVDGSQFVGVDIDHNYLTGSYTNPIVPANGSLAGLESGDLGTFAPGTLYTLTASVGFAYAFSDLEVGLALGTGAPALTDVFGASRSSAFSSELLNGGAFTSDALQVMTISLDTAAYTSLVGQPIDASLIFQSEDTYGRVALFDNVSLSSTSDAPEPNSMLLLAAAGLTTLFLTRRKSVS